MARNCGRRQALSPYRQRRTGVVYAIQGTPQSSGDASFTALAYDAQSGHQRWQSAQLGVGDLYQDKPVTLPSGAAIYVFNAPMSAGDLHPRAYALQPSSGAQIWTTSLLRMWVTAWRQRRRCMW